MHSCDVFFLCSHVFNLNRASRKASILLFQTKWQKQHQSMMRENVIYYLRTCVLPDHAQKMIKCMRIHLLFLQTPRHLKDKLELQIRICVEIFSKKSIAEQVDLVVSEMTRRTQIQIPFAGASRHIFLETWLTPCIVTTRPKLKCIISKLPKPLYA